MAAANVLRQLVAALKDGWKVAADKALSLVPFSDDSTLELGDGTDSWDVKIYGNTSSDSVDWDASANKLSVSGDAVVETRTGLGTITSNTTLGATDLNKIHTTRGAAGAVTVTLPAAASYKAGTWVEVYNVADQDLTIAGQDEELVVFNDLTADSIAYSTASEKIGGGFRCICDATSWIVVPLATETQTVTIASS